MPTAPTYPGVYIEEVPSGVRTISGVATSIAAFLGYFSRGPMNEAVRVFNFGDFERAFGGLRADSEAAYAIQQFFLNGGGQAYVVRVAAAVPAAAGTATLQDDGGADLLTLTAADDGAFGNDVRAVVDHDGVSTGTRFNLRISVDGEPATEEEYLDVTLAEARDAINAATTGSAFVTAALEPGATGRPGAGTTALTGGVDAGPVAAAIDLLDEAGGTAVLRVTAKNEGAWGNNVRVAVDHGILDPNGDPGALFNMTVSEVGLVNGRVQVLRQETYGNLVVDPSSPRHVVDVLDGSELVDVVLVGAPAPGTRPAQTGTISAPFGTGAGEIDVAPGAPTVSGGEEMQVSLDGGTPVEVTLGAGPFTTASSLASALQAALRAAGAAFERATVEVLGSGATRRFLRVRAGSDDPEAVLTFSDDGPAGHTLAGLLGLDDAVRSNVQQYALGAPRAVGAQGLPDGAPVPGADGALPGATDLTPDGEADKRGIYALLDVDLFNILCIPDTMRLGDAATQVVAGRATALCERERAFYILDVPQPPNPLDEPTEIEEWLDANASLRHKNAALYYPRPAVSDPLNDFRLREVAPSGTMAGVYARTDGTRGVWKAPAGTEAVLRGAQRLEYKLTDAENGVLNPLGINALRTLPVVGNVAWGARTLDGADQLASEWKYVPVRRLALYIEESLFRGTQWVVFEPNDEKLWAQIRLNVGTFMHTLFRQGAFQGTKPDQAYFVKCDAEVNPQADIDRGIVNVVVGFAPLKPAEFVIVKLQQMAGQLEV